MVILKVGQIDHLFRCVLVVISTTGIIVRSLLLVITAAAANEIHQLRDVGIVLDCGHFGAQFFVGFERDEIRAPVEEDFADQRPVLCHFSPCIRVEQKKTGPQGELPEFVGHVFIHQGSKVDDDQRRAHVKDEPIRGRRVIDFRRDEQVGPHDILESNEGERLDDLLDERTSLNVSLLKNSSAALFSGLSR